MSLPEQFGRYQVISVLGQGAMGLVYKAVDPVIERAVAVKVIQASAGLTAADLERMRARFEQEFRSAGALSHSNIVTVFDVGKEGDLYYIAMEFVEGRSLDDVLEERRVLTFEELGRLATELGAALDYAHGEGVVHRDIKPANVLLTFDGSAKVTDFGLAKLEATTLTRTGALVGTPAYMSPEQVAGHSITGRSDQFSLAILLYQALTGERPFTGDSAQTILYKIVHDDAVLPRTINPALPEPVDRVLSRALAKAPDQRHPSCSEFAESLIRALGAPISATGAQVSAAGAADPTIVAGDSMPLTTDSLRPTDPIVPLPSGQGPTPAATPQEEPAAATGGAAAASSMATSADVSQVSPALPTWLLAAAVILPSVALIAVVSWLFMAGVIGGSAPDPRESDLQASGGTEQTSPAAGPGEAAGAGDEANAEAGADSEIEAPQAATPQDIQTITDELRGEFQQLAEEVRESRDAQAQEPVAAEPQEQGPPDPPPDPGPDTEAVRPATVDYRITTDPEGALIRVDDRNTGQVTPTSVRLATNSDHTIEVLLRGYETTRYTLRMAGIPFEDIPDSVHVPMARATAAPGNERAAARGGGNRGNRPAENPRVREGVPAEIQQMIASGAVRTGNIVVSSPFAVALRITPADRSVIPPQIQERIRNASTPEERRRISAGVMAGFLMPEADEHRVELPVGNWRVNVLSPPVKLNHAQQVVVRATGDTPIEFPTRIVAVTIDSEPAGARVRINGLLPVGTPYRGPIVVGDHEFVFIWGDQTATTRAKIERDGQTVTGKR